jgi:hypothetical protein
MAQHRDIDRLVQLESAWGNPAGDGNLIDHHADVFLKSKENLLPEKRLPTRHTREILRLHFESHLAPRQIGSICKAAKAQYSAIRSG